MLTQIAITALAAVLLLGGLWSMYHGLTRPQLGLKDNLQGWLWIISGLAVSVCGLMLI